MVELERPELLAIARKNVNRLRMDRRLRWRELAGMAGVSEASLYNLNRGKPVSDLVLAGVAQAFGTDLEHLFYNAPDEPAQTEPQAPEDWREQLREIERNIRSIEDPIERLDTIRRLLAVTREYVGAYERRIEVSRASGRADAGIVPTPGSHPRRPGRAVG